MARYAPAVIMGAVVGFPLGVVTGNWSNAPGLFSLPAACPLVITGLLILGLLVAARRGHRSPFVAALALTGDFGLGLVVAPGPNEALSPGTGSAGTRTDPTVLWTGPVESHRVGRAPGVRGP